MIVDPYTRELFDKNGNFLKKLSCPKEPVDSDFTVCSVNSSLCKYCEREVYDTAKMTEVEVIEQLKRDPSSCLLIGFRQENCVVKPISNLIRESGE